MPESKTENKTLNKPFRLPSGSKKKFGVYVKNDKGNTVMVKFGDPNMEIRRDNPEARKNFRARHQCDTNVGPKWKARYWSCRMWQANMSVTEVAKGSCFEISFTECLDEDIVTHESLLAIDPSLASVEVDDGDDE